MQKPLIVVGGPTASGKTDLAIEIAKKINGEIISADSMQVYKYMDIGTAKPTKSQMQSIKHYLIDEIYPDEEFNVAIFKTKAKNYIDEIYKNDKVPILVGGTGFYIQAVVNDNDFSNKEADNSYRNKLYEEAKEYGNQYLHNKLKQIDSVSANKIHYNNVKRVIRALEFYEQNKIPISVHNNIEKQKVSPYKLKYILLDLDRQSLYNKINLRVDKMIEDGLVDEVKWLLHKGYNENLVSMQGLGYKELIPFIRGEISIEEATEEIKKRTRHFAKRQFTWFKHQCDGQWYDVSNLNINKVLESIKDNNLF